MKEFGLIASILATMIVGFVCGISYGEKHQSKTLNDEKIALEIKILQHELKAYEEMDKELKSEQR